MTSSDFLLEKKLISYAEETIFIIQHDFKRTILIPNVLFLMNMKQEKILLTNAFVTKVTSATSF